MMMNDLSEYLEPVNDLSVDEIFEKFLYNSRQKTQIW
jgi:hypothetical protein